MCDRVKQKERSCFRCCWWQKVTGRELQYTALVGKPSEITFRYAEHVLTSQTRKLGFNRPIKTMYLIG